MTGDEIPHDLLSAAADWIPCSFCDGWWCRIHDMHAHDCPCPPVDEWDCDPYVENYPTCPEGGRETTVHIPSEHA